MLCLEHGRLVEYARSDMLFSIEWPSFHGVSVMQAFGSMMSTVDLLGYSASLLVLVTFCMHTMVPLRCVAIGSNVLFMAFGYFAHIYPVMLLHAILLPVNVTRLVQILRLIRDARQADEGKFSIES